MCVGLSRIVSATVYITANTGRLATGVRRELNIFKVGSPTRSPIGDDIFTVDGIATNSDSVQPVEAADARLLAASVDAIDVADVHLMLLGR